MHNVFHAWHTMNKMRRRSICFKGADPVKETAAEVANAEVAMKEFNDYMTKIRPFENQFIADVSAPTANREAKVMGMTNADMAQKVGTPAINPNQGMDSQSISDLATTIAGARIKGAQAVTTQKAAGLQSVIDIGRGKATSAQLGMQGLASNAANQAANSAASQQAVDDSQMSAGATLVGAAAGMGKNMYTDSQKKVV